MPTTWTPAVEDPWQLSRETNKRHRLGLETTKMQFTVDDLQPWTAARV